MNYYIGEAAGRVYDYLTEQKNSEATITKLEKDLDLSENFVSMGIGWLAQEGKADLSGKGARAKVRLLEGNN